MESGKWTIDAVARDRAQNEFIKTTPVIGAENAWNAALDFAEKHFAERYIEGTNACYEAGRQFGLGQAKALMLRVPGGGESFDAATESVPPAVAGGSVPHPLLLRLLPLARAWEDALAYAETKGDYIVKPEFAAEWRAIHPRFEIPLDSEVGAASAGAGSQEPGAGEEVVTVEWTGPDLMEVTESVPPAVAGGFFRSSEVAPYHWDPEARSFLEWRENPYRLDHVKELAKRFHSAYQQGRADVATEIEAAAKDTSLPSAYSKGFRDGAEQARAAAAGDGGQESGDGEEGSPVATESVPPAEVEGRDFTESFFRWVRKFQIEPTTLRCSIDHVMAAYSAARTDGRNETKFFCPYCGRGEAV